MTTIQHLPDEVLRVLFEDFDTKQLVKFQNVCYAWYTPAHFRILRNIFLQTPSSIEQFITSLDQSPNPLYLEAVDRIHISLEEYPNYYLKRQDFEKLFFRFSKLTSLWISGKPRLLDDFNDDICKTFIKRCPHLRSFNVHIPFDNANHYFLTMQRVRYLVTDMEPEAIELVAMNGIPLLQYMSLHPRLETMHDPSEILNNFEKWLPLIQQLPKKRTFMFCDTADRQGFAERYLLSKSENEQDVLLHRLSRVTELMYLPRDGNFCPNSVKFASKYLTGLQTFTLVCNNAHKITRSQEKAFCSHVLDIVRSTKVRGTVQLIRLKYASLQNCFPAIFEKFFHRQTTYTTQRILNLMFTSYGAKDSLGLDIEYNKAQSERSVGVMVGQRSIQEITSTLFASVKHMESIDVLGMSGMLDNYHYYLDVDILDELLDKMVSLKKLKLELPKWFECKSKKAQGKVIPELRDLILCATPTSSQIQLLLKRYTHTFPKLTSLRIDYYSGTFNKKQGEYYLDLSDFSLDRLDIDLTPVFSTYAKMLKRQISLDNDFIVVEVNKQKLYKAPLHLYSIQPTTNDELKGLVQGKDYLKMKIDVKNWRVIKTSLYADLLIEGCEVYNYFFDYPTLLGVKHAYISNNK